MLPAAAIWSAIGIVAAEIGAGYHLVVVSAALVYAAVYGVAEAKGIRLPMVDSNWQVPGHWVQAGGRIRDSIWGVILGPGLLTRNPYASMWILPFVLAAEPSPWLGALVGCCIGVTHGGARATTVLALHRRGVTCSPIRVLPWQGRFRYLDGLILLFAVGAAGALLLNALPGFAHQIT